MPPTRSRADARARHAAVEAEALEVLERLMAEGASFTEISFQRLAQELGIPRTTLYVQFRDKSGLLVRLSDLAVNDIFDAAATWFRADHSTGQAGAEAAVGEMVAVYRQHRYLISAVIEMATYDAAVADYWFGRVRRFIDEAGEQLRRRQQAGDIAPDVDVEAVAEAITWMVERTVAVHLHTVDEDDAELRRLVKAMGRTIWMAVYGR